MRFLVQSQRSGRFLVPSPFGDLGRWVRSLREAGGGVVCDEDSALQLMMDHCEPEDRAQLIDLDRLGTADDYVDGEGSAGGMRSVPPAGAESALPDGNHGENIFRGTR